MKLGQGVVAEPGEGTSCLDRAVVFGGGTQGPPACSLAPRNLAVGTHTPHPSFTLLPVPPIGQTQLESRGEGNRMDYSPLEVSLLEHGGEGWSIDLER